MRNIEFQQVVQEIYKNKIEWARALGEINETENDKFLGESVAEALEILEKGKADN